MVERKNNEPKDHENWGRKIHTTSCLVKDAQITTRVTQVPSREWPHRAKWQLLKAINKLILSKDQEKEETLAQVGEFVQKFLIYGLSNL